MAASKPTFRHFATSPRLAIKPHTYDYGIPHKLSTPLVAVTTSSVTPKARHLGIEPNVSSSPWWRWSVSSIETCAAPSILCPIGRSGLNQPLAFTYLCDRAPTLTVDIDMAAARPMPPPIWPHLMDKPMLSPTIWFLRLYWRTKFWRNEQLIGTGSWFNADNLMSHI